MRTSRTRPGRHKDTIAYDRILSRFTPRLQDRICRYFDRSPRYIQLHDTFPAILVALSDGSPTRQQRRRTCKLIEEGAPLRSVAESLDLPWWLRRVPAEAVRVNLDDIPRSAWFNRQIVNSMPATPPRIRTWLEWVTNAVRNCNEEYALWFASQPLEFTSTVNEDPFCLMAAWAWYSGHPELAGHKYIDRTWHRKQSFARAYEETKAWVNRIKLVLWLGDRQIADNWCTGGRAAGLEFVPLRSADDFFREAAIMCNCADQFADRLREDRVRLFSMRRAGKRVATLSIEPHRDQDGIPAIGQLRCKRNIHADGRLWEAAYRWLGAQTLGCIPGPSSQSERIDQKKWREIFGPYLAERGPVPGLPRVAEATTLARIDDCLSELDLKTNEISYFRSGS